MVVTFHLPGIKHLWCDIQSTDVKLRDFFWCFVFLIFCSTFTRKNCSRILKLANKNYLNLYWTWFFHTYWRSFWPQPVMQNLNLLRPNFAHLHQKFSFLVLFKDNWNSLIWPAVVVVRKPAVKLKGTLFRAWQCLREVMRFWTDRYAGELNSP